MVYIQFSEESHVWGIGFGLNLAQITQTNISGSTLRVLLALHQGCEFELHRQKKGV